MPGSHGDPLAPELPRRAYRLNGTPASRPLSTAIVSDHDRSSSAFFHGFTPATVVQLTYTAHEHPAAPSGIAAVPSWAQRVGRIRDIGTATQHPSRREKSTPVRPERRHRSVRTRHSCLHRRRAGSTAHLLTSLVGRVDSSVNTALCRAYFEPHRIQVEGLLTSRGCPPEAADRILKAVN